MKGSVRVANVLVEINLRVAPFAAFGAEAGAEDVVVLDTDVLGGKVERHDEFEGFGVVFGLCER